MAIQDMAALKAAFAKNENKQSENKGWWEHFYPFFKMGFDETAIFRFLPDADADNPMGFIVENKYHELTINGKKKKIACLQMYGEACPCCERSKHYYDAGDSTQGKLFWRKIEHIAQGLVIHSPFENTAPTANPVRLLSIGTKLYKRIETAISAGDMDALPFDPVEGYNFRITKTKQGEYADYTSSDFARRSEPVPAELLEKMELFDLKNYRFAKVEREAMELMIESVLTGQNYDQPASGSDSTGSPSLDAKLANALQGKEAAAPAATVSAPVAAAPATTPAAGVKMTPAEILAKFQQMQKKA